MRLPPYGKSIDQSKDTVWLWAGEKTRVHQTVRTFGKNTLAFYAPDEPADYVWFVKNRDVALVHFFEPGNFWVRQIILSLLKAGASRVAEISMPYTGAWWNPHYNIFNQFLEVAGYDRSETLTINHYSRS
jgi:hypothetical protein